MGDSKIIILALLLMCPCLSQGLFAQDECREDVRRALLAKIESNPIHLEVIYKISSWMNPDDPPQIQQVRSVIKDGVTVVVNDEISYYKNDAKLIQVNHLEEIIMVSKPQGAGMENQMASFKILYDSLLATAVVTSCSDYCRSDKDYKTVAFDLPGGMQTRFGVTRVTYTLINDDMYAMEVQYLDGQFLHRMKIELIKWETKAVDITHEKRYLADEVTIKDLYPAYTYIDKSK